MIIRKISKQHIIGATVKKDNQDGRVTTGKWESLFNRQLAFLFSGGHAV
jgi:hypothetical protein